LTKGSGKDDRIGKSSGEARQESQKAEGKKYNRTKKEKRLDLFPPGFYQEKW